MMIEKTAIMLCVFLFYFFSLAAEQDLGVIQRFKQLDAHPNQNPHRLTTDIAGAFRSKLDIQVHPYCFQFAPSNLSQGQIQSRLEKAFHQIAEKMLQCQTDFSELRPFLREWVHQFRRAVILCSPKKALEFASKKRKAINAIHVNLMVSLLSRLPRKAYAGVIDRVNFFQHLPYHGKPTFFLASDVFQKLLDLEESLWAQRIVIHEVLHAARADNRSEHGDFDHPQYFFAFKHGEQNIMQDRIHLLSYACSQAPFYDMESNQNYSILHILHDRMQSNGNSKECVQVFTKAGSSLSQYEEWQSNYPISLPQNQAEALCKKMEKTGHCHKKQFLFTYDKKKWLKNNRRLQVLFQEVRDKWVQAWNFPSYQLPPILYEFFPEAGQIRAQLQQLSCNAQDVGGIQWQMEAQVAPFNEIERKIIQWRYHLHETLERHCDDETFDLFYGSSSKLFQVLMQRANRLESLISFFKHLDQHWLNGRLLTPRGSADYFWHLRILGDQTINRWNESLETYSHPIHACK